MQNQANVPNILAIRNRTLFKFSGRNGQGEMFTHPTTVTIRTNTTGLTRGLHIYDPKVKR